MTKHSPKTVTNRKNQRSYHRFRVIEIFKFFMKCEIDHAEKSLFNEYVKTHI